MSNRTPPIEKLEKQLRVFKKKLERSEWHRVDLENQHDRDQHLYRRLHADLEAAHRKAQIEAALERVRGVAMAMRTPDELSGISETVFTELKALGFTELRNTEIIINHDTEESITSYYYSDYGVTGIVDVAYNTNPILAAWARDMQKADDAFAEVVIAEDEMEVWRAYRLSLGYVPDPKLDEATTVYYYSYSIGLGALSISSFQPVGAEQLNVLAQFRNVFNLAYQRYVDIARAEAQAREAQIEAALERVRARTMAMQSSDELAEVSRLLNREVRGLGTKTWGCAFNIYGEDESTEWFGTEVGPMPTYPTPREDVFLRFYEKGQEGETLYIETFEGDACKAHYDYMSTLPVLGDMLADIKAAGHAFPSSQIDHVAYFKFGYLLFITLEPTPEAHDVFRRFARAFEQTYTRFLDLKQAEAQAREAEIELALERVRARTMAMQKSTQISEVAHVLYQQLQHLGGQLWGTGFAFCTTESDADEFWFVNQGGILPPVTIPNTEDPVHIAMYEGWKNEMALYSEAKGGAELKAHYEYMRTVPDVRDFFQDILESGLSFPTWQKWHAAYFSHGYLLVITVEPYEEEKIFIRFAKVFEQAYIRFKDLQRAESQAREAQIEAAMERVRSRALAMTSSEELLDVIFKIHKEFSGLGLPCGAFWHTRYTPESYYKALTGIEGEKLAAIMELPRDFTSNPALAAWERGDEEIGVFKFDTDAACRYHHHMVTKGRFFEVDPEAITEEMIRENDGWTFVQARTSHGEIGYSLWGETEPSDEAKDVLVRFANAFDLAYRRFLDLQQAEEQTREAQVQLALERIRTQSLRMQHSSELVATSAVFHEQLLALGVATEFSYVWLPDEAAGKHQFWATWTSEEDSEPAHHSRAITYDLDKSEPYTAACFAAWERDDPIHVERIPPGAVEHFFATWAELIGGAEHLRPERFPDGIYYAEGYMQYGCFGINIRREPDKAERDILRRFAVEFERAYTRFLDLRRAEAQAREAEIEAALERVRARAMAMHRSDELAETAAVVHEQLRLLGFEPRQCGFDLIDRETLAVTSWVTNSEGEFFLMPGEYADDVADAHPVADAMLAAWQRGEPGYSITLEGEALRAYENVVTHHLRIPSDEWVRGPQEMSDRVTINHFHFSHGILFVRTRDPLTSEKLEVGRRFAGVFELAYRRFLDLKQAEAQAREAQIEAALERVRSRAMAMHSSDDLSDATAIVFTELEKLGISTLRCGIVIIDETRHMDTWTATATSEDKDVRIVGRIDTTIHPLLEGVFEAWKAQQPFFTYELAGEDLQSYYQALRNAPDYAFPQDARPSARQFHYTFFFPEGALFTFSEQPLAEEPIQIFKRFAAVFALTYRRYLDLKQAEEQAREAQIEAALERVRSRTMAMQKSEELPEAANLLFQQIQSIGIPVWSTAFNIFSKDKSTVTCNVSSEGQLQPSFILPLTEETSFKEWYDAIESKKTLFVQELGGKDLEKHYEYLFTLPGVKDAAKPLEDEGIALPTYQMNHICSFEHGFLLFITYEKVPDAHSIFRRFTSAFQQTYTRFLDLQRAEAQAREAQIEAALEKVRSRTMAMQRPDELQEVVTVVAERLMDLGVVMDAGGVIICTYFPNSKDVMHWLSSPDFSSSKPYLLPYFDHPIFNDAWASRESGDEFFSKAFSVEEKNSFFLHAFEHSDYKYFPDEYKELVLAAEHHALTFAWSQNAAILIPSFTDIFPSESDKEILKRFARVFEQAYIRFLDLQQAAEQAREAERQAALDRVRAEIASMRTTSDLERITPLVWRELTTLGVPFFRCGVFIIDEAATTVQVFLTNPEGKALAVLHLGFDDAPLVTATVAHWRQEAVYTEEWDAAQMQEWTRFLQERGLIETSTRYLDAEAPPEHLALHFVPFAQGMLYVGSKEPLDAEAIESVQALADAFAVAYARYEDFQRLEAKNREVEVAMDDLKAAQQQLVHAEKMASLGALTAGIAHEIKNPLNFINNFAEVNEELADELREDLADHPDALAAVEDLIADLRQNAAVIAQHGKRADGIVRSMMQHARGGEGQREAIDLNTVVAEYVDLAFHGKRAQVPGFNAEIEKDLNAGVGRVAVVPQEIGRVLLNLIGNAFDAVYEHATRINGGYVPTVTVSTRQVDEHVEIKVKDNGPGIPAALSKKIFEPFFTTKPTGTGTGLGLSLSYDIVTQGHGGTLTVESEEGKGATFIVTLPVSKTEPASSA